jgi:Domain of unknown function (DUF4402)
MIARNLLSHAVILSLAGSSGLAANSDARMGGLVKDERSIQIEIVADLNFSRAAVTNSDGAEIAIAADQSNRTSATGLIDLGGYAMAGQVRIYGEPGRAVRVDLPHMVKMHAAGGGNIEISDMRSNLPPDPRLDAQGELHFAFGGRLKIIGNVSGAFRGRIPITVEYQ